MPLTDHQQETLTSIVHTIDSQETFPHEPGCLARPILVTGDAGTGKTVVATLLFYYLRTHDRYRGLKIGLVYTVSATRAEIQKVFKDVRGLYKRDVVAPIVVAKQRYDIVICDEAQRLPPAPGAERRALLQRHPAGPEPAYGPARGQRRTGLAAAQFPPAYPVL